MRKREHDEQCKQTFINKQLCEAAGMCEQMKRAQIILSIRSHVLIPSIGAPLEHGILESRIFDKKRVFGLWKVMWKHWTMENVTCLSILPPSSTSKIKWNKNEERRKKGREKKIIKSMSMIVNFLAVFNRIWCYIGTSHWYSHSNFPHSVCCRIRIRIVSCLRFNTLGPLGKFIVCCILPHFPSHREHTFAAL